MKKTLLFLLIMISNWGFAQSNHTVNFTGSSSDFNGSEKYSAQGSGQNTDYYITFDGSNLYIGAFRTSGSTFGSTDNLAIYIDTDPNATPTSGTGTSIGQTYNGVSVSLPFSANYNVHAEQSYQEARSFGSSWASTITGPTYYTTTTSREVKIPFSSIGSPNSIYLTMWMGYMNGFYSNAPGTNISAVQNPTITNYFGGIGLSSAGCIPKNITNTPITDILTNGNPAAGATYGKVSISSGTNTAAGNFSVASGGSISITSGTLTLGSNTLTMGAGSTIDNSGGTFVTTGSTLSSSGDITFSGTSAITLNTISLTTGSTVNVATNTTISTNFTLGSGATYNFSFTGDKTFTTAGITTTGSNILNLLNGGSSPNSKFITTSALSIGTGTTFSLGTSALPLQVNSDVTLNGTGNLTLGSNVGGDIYLTGNWSRASGVITFNSRAVTFNGTGTQTISAGTPPNNFDYLAINNSGGNVQLLNAVSIANDLQLFTGTLDLNQQTLTLNNFSANIQLGTGSNTASTESIISTGGTGTITIPTTKTTTITKNGNTGTPTFTFGNNVLVDVIGTFNPSNITTITFASGSTLRLSGGTVSNNSPSYSSGANLIYNGFGNASGFNPSNVGLEWPASNSPTNITLSSESNSFIALASSRTITGNFTLGTGTALKGNSTTLTLSGGTNISPTTFSNSGTMYGEYSSSLLNLTFSGYTQLSGTTGYLDAKAYTISGTLDCANIGLNTNSNTGGNGSVTISSTGTLKTTNVNGLYDGTTNNTTIRFSSSLMNAPTINPTSTVEYNAASGNQVISPLTYGNLILSGAGSRTLGGSITVTIGTLAVPTGITLNTNTSSNVITGMVNIQSGATFAVAQPGGINGAVSNSSSSTFSTSANYTFNGTSSQVFGAALPITVNNLTISNGNASLALNGNQTITGALTLSGGTKLVIGSNTLTLNGTFSGDASNCLKTTTASNISIGGSSAVGTLYFDAANNALNNLAINNSYTSGAAITLGNALNVSGVITPTAGQLAAGNNLTLLSTTNTGGGAIGAATGNTFTTNYITGSVTVQRYTQAQRGYRTIANPFNSAQALSQLTNTIRITGLTATNGTYGVNTGNPSAFYYDPTKPAGTSSVLQPITSATDASHWPVGSALYVFIRGNGMEGSGGPGSGNYSGGISPVTLSMSGGTINQGSITVNLPSYTSASADNYNLIGNPYPCPVNLKNVVNISGFGNVYVYDPLGNTGLSDKYTIRGGFHVYSTNSDIIIPTLGGFYIQSTGTTPTSITFNESDKTTSLTPTYTTFGVGTTTPHIRLSISTTNGNVDDLKFGFNANSTAMAKDFYDAPKLSNSLFDFYSLSSDKQRLAIDYRNSNTLDSIIPLGISTNIQGNYTLNLAELSGLPNIQLVLRDKLLKTETPLSQVGDSYSFTITADTATKGDNRFELGLLSTTVLPVTITDITAQLQTNKTVAVNWTSATEVNLANYNIQRSLDGTNFSTIGKVAAKGAGAYNYIDDLSSINTQATTLYYRLEAVDNNGSKSYSKVVNCQLAATSTSINIYPNPVQSILHAQITATNAGTVKISVIDAQGKVVATQKTTVVIGINSIAVPVAPLTAGNYMLEIESANGKQQQRFVKE
ncbi:beta strand repeat-containing protein [Parasediminibacterium paludis]|uniref:Beta strand repeat-containing protein n=1 Tax=Parasediminibacterium paludis TaxID=908966 RepID=A0ABV8PUM5_9BACT